MKSYPAKFESFQQKIVQIEALQKLQNSIQTLKQCGLSTQSIETLYFG